MNSHSNAWQQNLLSDPQTSGGLLISCSPEATDQVLEILKSDGFSDAQIIGRFEQGSGISVV